MTAFFRNHYFVFYPIVRKLARTIYRRDVSKGLYAKILKYYSVATSTVILNYILFNVLYYCGFGTTASNLITYSIVFIVAFTLQKLFTFKATGWLYQQFLLFLIYAFVFYLFDTCILIVLIDKLSFSPLISKIISIALISPINFIIQKKYVFIDGDI